MNKEKELIDKLIDLAFAEDIVLYFQKNCQKNSIQGKVQKLT